MKVITMSLLIASRCHRFPISIISHAVWLYHRFNHSYRDIQEQMASWWSDHQTQWCSLHSVENGRFWGAWTGYISPKTPK